MPQPSSDVSRLVGFPFIDFEPVSTKLTSLPLAGSRALEREIFKILPADTSVSKLLPNKLLKLLVPAFNIMDPGVAGPNKERMIFANLKIIGEEWLVLKSQILDEQGL